jgi:Ras-related protein Rab-2A
MSDFEYIFKYIIIGDSSVGKSSLISSLMNGYFKKEYTTTIGVDFASKMIVVGDNLVKIQIWDTAGQEAFKSITKSYYRGAIGCLIVFDITSIKSFENVKIWLNDVNHSSRSDKRQIMIVGNKKDMKKYRAVSKQEIDNLLSTLENIKYFETSAYDIESVDKCFEILTLDVINNLEEGKIDTFGYGVKKIPVEHSTTKYHKYTYCC